MTIPQPPGDWVPVWDTKEPAHREGVGAIPGEVKVWPNTQLPNAERYGVWVFADGADYAIDDHPEAADNIDAAWRTMEGLPDPGPDRFRVPDLRGLVVAALDQMPGNAQRRNRVTRAAGIYVAGRAGVEYHTLQIAEMPHHDHGVGDPTHAHGVWDPGHTHSILMQGGGGTGGPAYAPLQNLVPAWYGFQDTRGTGIGIYGNPTGIWIGGSGGGGAHETLQPTVFVPYIVKLDGDAP